MRPSYLALVALLALAHPASAQSTICSDGSTSSATGRGACSAHGGVDAKATAAAAARAKRVSRTAQPGPITYKPSGNTVTCTDGTASIAGRGACSHHGGVSTGAATTVSVPRRADPPMSAPMPAPTSTPRMQPVPRSTPAPSTRSTARAGATAQCRDGTYSYSANRKGTCSHHGGVSVWM